MIRRLYRLMLLLLPRSFRRRHGEDMEVVFLESLRRERERGRSGGGARAGIFRVLTRLCREGADLARAGAELRREHDPRGTGGGG